MTYTIRVWDLHTKKERACLGPGDDTGALAFSPDGRRLAAGVWPGRLRFWDTATWDEQRLLAGYVGPLAFAPAGKTLAVAEAGSSGTAFLLDAASGAERVRLAGRHELDVFEMAFAPDGRHLVSVGARGPIHLWSMPTGTLVLTIPLPTPGKNDMVGFMDVAFAPDSLSFATAGADRVIRIWEMGERTEKRTFPRQRIIDLRSLAYSADGRVLVVGCGESPKHPGSVQFWDVATATKIATVGTQESGVRFVRFIPGRPHLVVGALGENGYVEVWDVSRLLGE